jgi:hypothetical protein
MSVTTKMYIRTFILSALFFGIMMSVFEHIESGEVRWVKQVISAILFGLFMSFWSTLSAKRTMKLKGIDNPKEDDFKVVQTASIDSSLGAKQVLDLINTDVDTKAWKVKLDDENNIKGRTDLSWKSWGEKICLKFQNGTIKIESKPLIPTTLVDGGKNLSNVLTLKRIIVNATS